jgi:O-methyltransferase involved in polyketide biosynthesis
MTHDAERIGPTAHYTAYVWRRAGLPHAEHFATGQGAVLYWGLFALGEWATRVMPSMPSMRQYLEYRHRLIDAVVARQDPGCVVELGAGLTRRAVTWAADRGVPGLELDLPAMAAVKRRRLAMAPAALRQRLEARHAVHDADVLAPGFSAQLAALLEGHARPVVVAEGLLGYFDLEPRLGVLSGVAAALRRVGGGCLVCDVHTATAQAQVGLFAHALRTAIRGLTRRRHALAPFPTVAALHQAFAAAGFDHSHDERPEDHVAAEPALRHLRSPAHVILARVEPPGRLGAA